MKSTLWQRHDRAKSPNATLVVAEHSNTIAIPGIGQNKEYSGGPQTSSSLVLWRVAEIITHAGSRRISRRSLGTFGT